MSRTTEISWFLVLMVLMPFGIMAQGFTYKRAEAGPASVQLFWNGGSGSGIASRDFTSLQSTITCGPNRLSKTEYETFKSEFGIRIDCEISLTWTRLGFTFPSQHFDTAYWLIQEMVLRPDTLSKCFTGEKEHLKREYEYYANDPDTLLKRWANHRVNMSLVSTDRSKTGYRRQRNYIESIGLEAKPNGDLPYVYPFTVNHNLFISVIGPYANRDSLVSSTFESLWKGNRLTYYSNAVAVQEGWTSVITKKAETFLQKGTWVVKKPLEGKERVALELGLMMVADSLNALNAKRGRDGAYYYDFALFESSQYASISFQSKDWKEVKNAVEFITQEIGESKTSEELALQRTVWLNTYYTKHESNRAVAIEGGIRRVEGRKREYAYNDRVARRVLAKDVQEQLAGLEATFFMWGTD